MDLKGLLLQAARDDVQKQYPGIRLDPAMHQKLAEMELERVLQETLEKAATAGEGGYFSGRCKHTYYHPPGRCPDMSWVPKRDDESAQKAEVTRLATGKGERWLA
jgi:hypothetical protein